MKVIHQDARNEELKVKVDSLDDLWHLFQIIEKGDHVKMLTFRRIELTADESARAERAEKKRMLLTLTAETVEFHEFANRLRVTGAIVEGPQDHGAFHTFNVEENDEITIVKPAGWKEHQLMRVKEAVTSAKRPSVVFLAMEDGEATLAVMRQYGVREVNSLSGRVGGKQHPGREAEKEKFFLELLQWVRDLKSPETPLILIGPGFAKEEFMKFGKEKEPALFSEAIIENTGHAGMTGVQESIKRGVVARVQKENRVALETQLVEKLLEAISVAGPAAYGETETRIALQAGAVETLLISDKFVREHQGEGLMLLAKQSGADVKIISSEHESGRKFGSLGGCGAFLRYKLQMGTD
jgi:protein pelota